jgi:hypothetical protein
LGDRSQAPKNPPPHGAAAIQTPSPAKPHTQP